MHPASHEPTGTIALYHFTAAEYLSSILNHGIDTGQISLNKKEFIQAISLTAIGLPGAQRKWASVVEEKLKIRLKCEFPVADPLLLKWKFFKDKFRIDPKWFRTLTECGGGDPYKWFVYLGIIPPDRIVDVWDTEKQRALNPEEIDAYRMQEEFRGEYITALKQISIEDARR